MSKKNLKNSFFLLLILFFVYIIYNSKMVAIRDGTLVSLTQKIEYILDNKEKLDFPLNKKNIYKDGNIIGYKGNLPLGLLSNSIYKDCCLINTYGNILCKTIDTEKLFVYENVYFVDIDRNKYKVELFFEDKENIPIPENNSAAGIDRNIRVGFLRFLKNIGIDIKKYKYTFGDFKF